MDKQLYFYIGFIVVTWLFIFGTIIGRHLDKKIDGDKPKTEKVPEERACPPHKWAWEDQIGMEGVTLIRCQRCRRLPGWIDKT